MPERYYSAEQPICPAASGNSEMPFASGSCENDDGREHIRPARATNGGYKSLEAALLIENRYESSFDDLPDADRELATEAFSFGENDRFFWDRCSPAGRLSQARQWDFENDPANDALRENMWNLQWAIPPKLAQLADEITLLETAPPTLVFDSGTRETKLVQTGLKLRTLKEDEAEFLSAGHAELHSVVDRLIKAHPYLVSSPAPTEKPITSDAQPTAVPGDGAEIPIQKRMRPAAEVEINAAITAVYDHAASNRMKPPNLKQIAKPVLAKLSMTDLTATKNRIERLADSPGHWNRRGKPGPRVNGSLLAFSIPEMWKSGSEM